MKKHPTIMIELKCNICDKIFKRKKFALDKAKKRNQINFYCSKHCNDIARKETNQILKMRNPYKWYIRLSKYRNSETDLSSEYLEDLFLKQNKKCIYTKVDLKLWDYKIKGGNNKLYTASLDRIDSSKGYIKGNVQFVSMSANLFKHTMSHEETIEFIKIIVNNNKDMIEDIVHS